jgi:large subunit ribosomal protein L10e
MRGAWGKPNGLAARVKIGSILYSVRVKEAHIRDTMEGYLYIYFKLIFFIYLIIYSISFKKR